MRELPRWRLLRHPYITYVYDAFGYRDTFYIITERCYCPVSGLFTLEGFRGPMTLGIALLGTGTIASMPAFPPCTR